MMTHEEILAIRPNIGVLSRATFADLLVTCALAVEKTQKRRRKSRKPTQPADSENSFSIDQEFETSITSGSLSPNGLNVAW